MSTRNALLNAAETACRARGYDGFSYADLAKEVGIRKPSIHHHFPTKADLIEALITHYSDQFFARLSEISVQAGPASSQLHKYLNIYRDQLAGGSQLCLCVALSLNPGNLNAVSLDALNGFHAKSVKWLSDVFLLAERDGSITHLDRPQVEAIATLALVEGAQILSRAAGDITPYEVSIRRLSKRLLLV